MIEELSGGRGAAIYRKEDKVLRPAGPWSPAVHTLLNHLERVGFSAAPKSFGFDDNDNEILSFVPGETTNFPLDGAIVSSHALISAAELLRAYHDASSSLIEAADVTTMRWMLPTVQPIEVICHGDFAPYNVALNGSSVVGVFDFDTAHPALGFGISPTLFILGHRLKLIAMMHSVIYKLRCKEQSCFVILTT